MNEYQLAGIIIISTALLCFLLAVFIEKTKRYGLFSGWNPVKMTDPDNYGKLLCKALKIFAIVLGLAGVLIAIIQPMTETLSLIITIASVVIGLIVLVYYMLKAKKLYGK